MSLNQWEISEADLRARFRPETLPFETTRELAPCEEVIGQERAVRAIDFGLGMSDPSYNIFVAGSPGTGRNSIVKAMVRRVAETLPVPDDWIYVNNFKTPDRPIAISLSAGKGRQFQKDMARLIQFLRSELAKIFQSQEYQDKRRNLEEEMSRARDVLSNELDMRAREYGFLIENSPLGIMIVPLLKGKPIKSEEMDALDPALRADIQKREKELHEHIHAYVRRVRILREEADQKIEALNRQVAEFSSRQAFEALYTHYEEFPKILDHIHSVQADILENIKEFLSDEKGSPVLPGLEGRQNHFATNRYGVNVVVDNSGKKGAPLVMEANPTYNNMVGQIEKRSLFGAFYTDFTMIKAGSVLQANGGFLLVNVLDLLRSPFSWDALKRIIRNRELKIEDIAELYGLSGASGIKPEPIPVKVRVVLLGSPMIYYLLQAYDEDFGKIFKVKADFDVQQDRKDDSPTEYGRFIAKLCQAEALRHFDRTGMASALDQIGRWVGHQKKLSLRFSDLADLVREASYWAGKEQKELVSARHVEKAVEEKIHRSNLLEDYLQELISEGTLMVDVTGSVTGQVNGLSVYEMGDFAFGKPSRITARTFLGEGGIVNIEREAKLSGKTHNKGVLILSGYLGGRYATENPLSLAATLAFEQSYGEVDGDSASAAELAAILSSISGIPIRQDIAMTGSINQRGEIQAIGGVNEKIEGFFSVCKAFGLSGTQGVIIPRANAKHLMLREEVIKGVAEGKFHVYAVTHVDEALEILTGRPAGAVQPDGKFPAGSLNEVVRERLEEMAEKMKAEEEETRSPVSSSVNGEKS